MLYRIESTVGTIKELDKEGVWINDHRLNQLELTTLARIGVFPVIRRVAPKGGRGNRANVLSVPAGDVSFSVRIGE